VDFEGGIELQKFLAGELPPKPLKKKKTVFLPFFAYRGV